VGRKYTEPTLYRDKRCPDCGYYFTARGLNGHIRFYHEGYEKHEIARLKGKLFSKIMRLVREGHKELLPVSASLGEHSDTSLDELREIDEGLAAYP